MPREEINKRLSRDLLRIESISFLIGISIVLTFYVKDVYNIKLEWLIPDISLPTYITHDLSEHAKYILNIAFWLLIAAKVLFSLHALIIR